MSPARTALAALSRQLLQERLGVLQVSGVKPFGEPAIDRGQQRAGLVPRALLLPQPAQAQRRPQLQRPGVLATGHGEGLTKTLLPCHHRFVSVTSLEQQLPFEPIQFRLVAPLPRPVHQRQRLVQQLLPDVALTILPICPGQKGQGIWPSGCGPGGLVRRQALPYLPHALLLLSLLDQYQAPAEHPPRQLERKPLRRRQGDEPFCLLASAVPIEIFWHVVYSSVCKHLYLYARSRRTSEPPWRPVSGLRPPLQYAGARSCSPVPRASRRP